MKEFDGAPNSLSEGGSDAVLGVGSRLAVGPAQELVRTAFARELSDQVALFRGMSLADLAHTLMLIEAGVILTADGAALLSALLALHELPRDFTPIPESGDLYTNREAWLAARTPAVGWLGAGRARRESTTIGYRITVRSYLLAFADALIRAGRALLERADEYRSTLMADYTYLQPAQPTTFGHYLLGFTYPLLRDLERLKALYSRTKRSFLVRLGLNALAISWTTARDTLAEWFNLLTLIASTGDKIGHEMYNLQRPKIDEVSEGFITGTVGSITMPHKRNPEISEHLGTLARVIRHNASLIAESLVHDHERDGRSWKTEWVVLAETCLAAGKLLELLRVLTGNLVIHTDRMQANLDATGGFVFSEALMLALAARIGKQSAHTLVYETAMNARAAGRGLKDAILDIPEFSRYLTIDEIEALFEYRQHTGHCGAMVDQVVAALRDADTPKNLM